MWNLIFAILSIVFGIGILKGRSWGYNWGLGTAFVNAIWFGYLFIETKSMLFLFFALIEIIIFIALRFNKHYFKFASPENIVISQTNNFITEENDRHQEIIKLNNLIISDKDTLFGSTNRKAIKELLKVICKSKEEAQFVLDSYQQLFAKDLVKNLLSLSNNYDSMKEYCQVFIDHNLVSEKHPHDPLE